jgi:nucleoside-diphosphate-sugar epimerase
MCSTALRFSTVYGFSPRIRFDLTVNEFTREAVLGKHLEVWGPQFWRPYCHVEDLSRSALLVLESEEAKVKSNVFGVGDTEENYQKGQIVKEIAKIVPNVDYAFVDKTEDPRDYRVNFDKIKNELGFTITKTVPDGIREIYKMVESGVLQDTYGQKYRNI